MLLLSKAKQRKEFWKPSLPCHVGICGKALTEDYQMSTHLSGFLSVKYFEKVILSSKVFLLKVSKKQAIALGALKHYWAR